MVLGVPVYPRITPILHFPGLKWAYTCPGSNPGFGAIYFLYVSSLKHVHYFNVRFGSLKHSIRRDILMVFLEIVYIACFVLGLAYAVFATVFGGGHEGAGDV